MSAPAGKEKTPPARRARTMGRPAGVDGEDTRRRIIRTAMECFASYGYAGTSTRTIAEKVGVAQTALYNYFATKADLMLAVHNDARDTLLGRLRAATEPEVTFEAKVRAMLTALHEALAEDPVQAVFGITSHDEGKRYPELRAIAENQETLEFYRELVAFGVKTGEIERGRAVAVRGVVAVLARGLVQLATDVDGKTHAIVTEACNTLIKGQLLAR